MRFALASATLATFATVVFAETFQVQVGSNGLNFNPTTVTAASGDTIEFVFMPKNHTVTQSTFAAPCTAMSSGIDSGYMPVAANATQVPSMTVTVNDTAPLWFYCKQSGYGPLFLFCAFFWLTMSYYSHCGQGMVFAVNPTADKTFEAFQAAAKGGSSSSPTSSTGSTGTGSGSSATSSPSPTNGAVAVGVRSGGILALVGLVAGVLL